MILFTSIFERAVVSGLQSNHSEPSPNLKALQAGSDDGLSYPVVPADQPAICAMAKCVVVCPPVCDLVQPVAYLLPSTCERRCVDLRNEGRWLKEWIEFHLCAGFGHFYILEDGSDDNTKCFLEDYIERGVVTAIPARYDGVQKQRYFNRQCIETTRARDEG